MAQFRCMRPQGMIMRQLKPHGLLENRGDSVTYPAKKITFDKSLLHLLARALTTPLPTNTKRHCRPMVTIPLSSH